MSTVGELAEAATMPRGRRMGNGPVGIIDIGSNSIRLVLYERASRAPTVFFNEKVLAGLGEDLSEHGRLSDESMSRAIAAISRFVTITEAADAQVLTIIATAAARDASNGSVFINEIEAITGQPVKVLSGLEEAAMAANGVLCGFWQPDGVVGDLGGGSLELIDVGDDGLGPGDSFPLGTLRLRGDAKGDLAAASKIASDTLSRAPQLPLLTGRAFYAVGGTWRSLVRLHMVGCDYPISVLHNYEVPGDEMAQFCDRILRDGIDKMPGLNAVSKNRRALVPWGAAVMREVIRRGRPDTVVASALGVREGIIYEGLGTLEKRRDPLLIAAEELALLRSRSPQQAAELITWTGQVFEALGVRESEQEKRLRAAGCLLSDIGWRAHPDYRGDQAIAIVSNVSLYGIDHQGRGYIALTLMERYGGLENSHHGAAAETVCPPRLEHRARLLAAAFRLAYVFAPGLPGILPRTKIEREAGMLVITLPDDLAALDGERPRRRLKQLARLVNFDGEIRIARSVPQLETAS